MISTEPSTPRRRGARDGFALVTALLMLTALASLAAVYFVLTNVETATTVATRDSSVGFSAAEGGLNLRGRDVRTTFVGYQRPTGSSPASAQDCADGVAGNDGSGDFACRTVSINGRDIHSYVVDETAAGPIEIASIRDGKYAGLSAQEYRYTVVSEALSDADETEARLRMVFRSRLVPLFQFAVFYENDLSFHNGPRLDMAGRVHTNANLFFGTRNGANIDGTVSAAGDIYMGHRREGSGDCGVNLPGRPGSAWHARIVSADSVRRDLNDYVGNCDAVTKDDVTAFGGAVDPDASGLTIPDPGATDPGGFYWERADLRLVLKLDNSNQFDGIEVQGSGGAEVLAASTELSACGAADFSDTFFDHSEREGGHPEPFVNMLEVDMQALLTCIDAAGSPVFGFEIDDVTDGGLVFHFSVDGPDSDSQPSLYGVRVRNGAELASTVGGAPDINGLTVVTEQALYVLGDYNRTDKKPAAFLADSLSVLSSAWSDIYDCTQRSNCDDDDADPRIFDLRSNLAGNETTIARDTNGNGRVQVNHADELVRLGDREATDTTINAALLGRNGLDEPGVHNGFIKQHEHWGGETLRIVGSFVSVGEPRRASGAIECCNIQYSPPQRDFNFDTDFRDAANLPPLSPRFVYLVQELFLRDYQDSAAFTN